MMRNISTDRQGFLYSFLHALARDAIDDRFGTDPRV